MFLGMNAFVCHQSSQQYGQDAGGEDTIKSAGTAD
jgi:hypothetical protein